MAVDNLFTITYAGRAMGGSSDTYQLHTPYVLNQSFGRLQLIFDVVVVSSSYSGLQTAADNLEIDFRKRDQDLSVDLNGSTFTWTSGTHLLNVHASSEKTGDPGSDRGYSRSYTCTVEGDLPVDDNSAAAGSVTGLRDLEWTVHFEPGRQRVVSVQGVYTATESPARAAAANYTHANGADIEASTFLDVLSSASSYELVDEDYVTDRNDHECHFTRQYIERLVAQSQSAGDDTSIRDHRITFTDLSSHPGDSQESIYRTRRVIGTYDCAIDIDVTTDLDATYTTKVLPHVKALFESNFNPQVWTVEDHRKSYDETAKRMSVSIQFLYQASEGSDIVEVTETLAFREVRALDPTYVHSGREFDADIDVGWAVRERIASRTVIVIGDETPKRRLGEKPEEGPAGNIKGIEGTKDVVRAGWNIISNTSQVTDQWMGDPNETQIKMAILTETVVERFNTVPGPITQSGRGAG